MRIVVTADLHYEPARRNLYTDFACQVGAEEPDCFVIAGDIGHPLRLYRRCLQLFETLACPKLLIPGNHDVYAAECDSRRLWDETLAAVANDEGFRWLEGRPFFIGPLAICGTMGWYDYSSAAGHMALDHHGYRRLKPLVNHDADYVNWPWSDRAMARCLHRSVARQLQTLQANPAVQQIIVVTHMPIFKQAIPDRPESSYWSLLQAYLGNITLGKLVARFAKVSHVISGHIHLPGHWTVTTDQNKIDFRIVGSTRGDLRWVTLDI